MGYFVRKANLDDLDFIQAELVYFCKFHKSIITADLNPYDDYSINMIKTWIENHVFLISEKNGIRTGFLFGFVYNHFFNPKKKCLSEMLFWVKDEYKKGRSSYYLFKEFNKLSEFFDWTTFAISYNTNLKPESLIKQGYRHNEISLVKEKGVSYG